MWDSWVLISSSPFPHLSEMGGVIKCSGSLEEHFSVTYHPASRLVSNELSREFLCGSETSVALSLGRREATTKTSRCQIVFVSSDTGQIDQWQTRKWEEGMFHSFHRWESQAWNVRWLTRGRAVNKWESPSWNTALSVLNLSRAILKYNTVLL